MSKLSWYVNRLRAMSVNEIAWRLQQKRIISHEKSMFDNDCKRVDEKVWNSALSKLKFNRLALGVNFTNKDYTTNTGIHQLSGPDFRRWPNSFSYSLDYKQMDDLGDARTCWEKHRHFQYALIAKKYFVTKDIAILKCLEKDFDEWNKNNPFLHGIAWTSVMEVAIRAVNWMFAMAFIDDCGLSRCMGVGVVNMVDYISRHYSRFSSANNHLLVEACAIGVAGYAFNNETWKRLALRILSEELLKQNYPDGVNKELSLHYQTFGMEAYCLFAHVMRTNGDEVPYGWLDMLEKQSEYVSHSIWKESKAMEFGDDDEGKIVDLHGGTWLHFNYILQFSSLITGKRYNTFDDVEENINWLFTNQEIEEIKSVPIYDNTKSRCFSIGGNSFLRDSSNRILIGIDHAELGFGPIAAHGHADALSLQMMIDGHTILADPGTYIYHCNLPMRNAFRKTVNHNTVCIIDNKGAFVDQSQMLGAFLWGKRAHCTLENWQSDKGLDVLTASHDGYRPITHQRTIEFSGKDTCTPVLRIKDYINKGKWVSTWLLGKDCKICKNEDSYILASGANRVLMTINTVVDKVEVEDADISEAYGIKSKTKAIRIYGGQNVLSVDFKLILKQ